MNATLNIEDYIKEKNMALSKKMGGIDIITPHIIYGFDTETWGIEDGEAKNGKMYMAWVTTPTEAYFFDDKIKLIEFFKSLSGDIWIVGHNVAYDLNCLMPEWNPDRLEWGGSFICCETEKDSGVFFVDLYKFIQKKEKQIAEEFKLNYIDEHFSKDINIKEACKSHAETARLALTKLQEIYNKLNGNLKFTASSTSFNIFLRNYLPYTVNDFGNKKYNDEIKIDCYKSYHGGATEIFKKGVFEDVIMLDVASMYPSQMLKPLPDLRKPLRWQEDTEKHFNKMVNVFEGCVQVTFVIPDMLIAPFLYEYVSTEKRILSHIGEYNMKWITFPEYRYICSLGATIKNIHQYIYYPRFEGFFNKFIADMWEYKKNPETKSAAKLNMNGLSGKFGQHNQEDSTYIEVDELKEVDIEELYSYNGVAYFKNVKNTFEYEFSHQAYPIISAYICGYARVYLHETMTKFGHDNILYCDTDSIAVINHSKKSLEKILGYELKFKDTELGRFELQWSGTMQPRALKYYRYKEDEDIEVVCFKALGSFYKIDINNNWHYKIKGLPQKYQKDFWQTEIAEVEVPRTRKVAIKSDKQVNAWFKKPYVSKNKSYKRIFHEDGTSEPFKL